jgi:hypothetical protein
LSDRGAALVLHHPLPADHSLVRETVPQRWPPEYVGTAGKKIRAVIVARRKYSLCILDWDRAAPSLMIFCDPGPEKDCINNP